jgi:predicted transcriptional regulator
MILESLKFLCPTKLFRELDMLVLIKDHPWMSQHSLAKKMGITGAMANFYMKDLIRRITELRKQIIRLREDKP